MNCSEFRRFCVAVAISALAIGLVFNGCSRNPVNTSSTAPQPQVLRRSGDILAKIADDSLYAEKVISADSGGQLTLFDVNLSIPPGAVPSDTVFSIAIPDLSVFYNRFGTDGLVFSKPVTVTMSYRDADLSGVDESTIRIAWYDERTGDFNDVVCTIDFEKKVVTGKLNHFSAYALISDCIGGLPPG
jgi:hypothetical protein